MEERFEKLIIGSAHEGAEGMFHQEEEVGAEPEEQGRIEEARQERGIFPDAQERYEKMLGEMGFEQVLELENGVKYPTLNQWIEHRISYDRGTKFFPSFVRDTDGKVFFCKAQLSGDPDALKGLEREAERLQNLPEGINAPKFEKYIPPQEGQAALLITEAISVRNGTVAPPELWSPEHGEEAARQIKILENQARGEVGTFDVVGKGRDLLSRAGDTVPKELKEKLERLFNSFESRAEPASVHGDAGIKNIPVGRNDAGEPAVWFVDWESDEKGFVGQDAAKLWSELRKNRETSRAFLESYLFKEDGSVDKTRKAAILFGVAVESLVHLVWRNEEIIKRGREKEYPDLQMKVREYNERIIEAMRLVEEVKQR